MPFEEAVEACETAAVLRFKCEDHDALSSADPMGVVDVPLRSLADRARTRRWFPLAPDPDATTANFSGDLELVLQQVSAPAIC